MIANARRQIEEGKITALCLQSFDSRLVVFLPFLQALDVRHERLVVLLLLMEKLSVLVHSYVLVMVPSGLRRFEVVDQLLVVGHPRSGFMSSNGVAAVASSHVIALRLEIIVGDVDDRDTLVALALVGWRRTVGFGSATGLSRRRFRQIVDLILADRWVNRVAPIVATSCSRHRYGSDGCNDENCEKFLQLSLPSRRRLILIFFMMLMRALDPLNLVPHVVGAIIAYVAPEVKGFRLESFDRNSQIAAHFQQSPTPTLCV